MRSKAIAVGCSSALALGLLTAAAPAMAGEKQINDDISLKWNLKASVGAISRMESARKENLFAGDTPGGTSGHPSLSAHSRTSPWHAQTGRSSCTAG